MVLSKLLLYISRNFISTLLIISTLIISCILVASIFEMFNNIRSSIIPFTTVIKVSLFKMPFIVGEILPLIIFISVLFTLDRLSKNHELIILLVSGLNIWKIITPIIIISVFTSIFYVTTVQPLSSALLVKSEILSNKAKNKDTSVIIANSGLYIHEKINNENRIYSARYLNLDDSSLNNFTVVILNKNFELLKKIESESAKLEHEKIILNGKLFALDVNGNQIEIEDKALKTNLNINTIIDQFTSPEKISFWKLASVSLKLNNSGINSEKYINYYYKLLFNPIYVFSIVLIAICFLDMNTRSNSTIKLIGSASIIAFSVHSFKEILTTYLISNGISSPISNILPTIILISISISIIFQKFESH